MRTGIKICCISSLQEAATAIHSGADALGLVGKMPGGPGTIDDELIASIAITIHPPVSSFLLTSRQSAGEIIDHVKKTGVSTVQIVDELINGTYEQIREEIPHLRIVQVIHITGEESIGEALKVHEKVDSLLLDSGNPRAAVKTLGGTGNIHDWNISSRIVKLVSVPVFLAGGLNADNVSEAIKIVRPFAVDVCSGVRTSGLLDSDKLNSFIAAVRADENHK